MNITNTIKLIGFFILLALFTNCEKDKQEHDHSHEHSATEHFGDKTISRLGIKDLKADKDFVQLTNAYELDKLINGSSNKKSANRLIDLDDGNFLVPDTINKIEKDGYVSYTFLVKNPNDSLNRIRNLILEKKGDSVRAYYLNYKLDQDWISDFANGSNNPPRGRVEIEEYKGELNGISSRTVCNYVNITVIIPCGCGDYSTAICRGCYEAPPRYPSSSSILVQVCVGGDDGDLWEMEDNDNIIGGGGSGGGGGGSGDGDSMMNLPIDELQKAGLIYRAKSSLIENISLNYSQKAWLDMNGDQVLLLNSLLVNHDYSQASRNAIIAIIDMAKGELEVKDKVFEIKSELTTLEPKLSQGIPRSTYIQRLVGINDFLRTHGYEDFATMMDPVIETAPGLSNKELYDLYSFMFDMGREVQASFMVAVIMPFVEVAQIMVEFALLDTGITLAVKLLKSLPPLLKSIEITEVIKTMETSTILSQFKFAEKFGIKSYKDHDKFFKALNIKRSELGVEIHHLIEKRFAETLKVNEADMASIVLTKSEHQVFTNAWRNEIGLNGTFVTTYTTETATKEVIFAAARRIYKDYPEILIALGL